MNRFGMTLEPAGFSPVRSGAKTFARRPSLRNCLGTCGILATPEPVRSGATEFARRPSYRNALEPAGFYALPSRFESIPSISSETDFAESAWNLRDFSHPRGGSKRLRANSLAPLGTPRNHAGSKHFLRSPYLYKFVTNASKRLGGG